MFKFKEPSIKTKNTIADVAINGAFIDYNKSIAEKLKKHTGHLHSAVTNSGNGSIYLALSAVGENLIVPDQGAWNGFKQIGKLLKKNITLLETQQGIINLEKLENTENGSTLILTSFAGYTAEQNMKEISKVCREKDITIIEDASAGIGDGEKKVGNGKYSDIIIASTGSPKIINAGQGGILTTDNKDVLEKTRVQQKITKATQITAAAIDSELENVEEKLEKTIEACKYLKNSLEDVIHPGKRGLNVIMNDSNPKELSWKLKQDLKINKSGFITRCPNYNRIKEKAVAIEIKNLDYNCLTKEKLDYIIETAEKYRN